MISFKNVTYKVKNKTILENITFNIKRGEKVLIYGNSGSGKSTIFNLLLKNIKLTSGIITYENENIYQYNYKKLLNYRQNEVIAITQKDDLFDNLTVFSNLTLFYYQDDVNKLLKKTKLFHLKNRYVYSLSGGERQRVSILKACLSSCNVLLCDEITSALDKQNALNIIDFIMKLFKNKTIIFISHDIDLFINKIDKILQLNNNILITKQLKVHDNYIYKSDIKPKKSMIKLTILQGIKKISLSSFLVFLINILCFYITFNFENIFSYFSTLSYKSYLNYDVLLINEDIDNKIKVDNIDVFNSLDDLFNNSSLYIDNHKFTNITFYPFNNTNNNSYLVLNSQFINKYNLSTIDIIVLKSDVINESFRNINVIDETNLFSNPCIYYDIKYFSKYNGFNTSNDKYIINYDFTNIDDRFTNNPMYENKKENKPYLSNNAYYDYLTYKIVFDGISMIVDYFIVIIMIISTIILILINMSFLLKDIKKIGIYISRGFSDFKILMFYIVPLLIYSLIVFLIIHVHNLFLYPYVLSMLIYLFSICFSYFLIKQKSLNELLKNEVLT